ncbi:MAG: hypothetical protein GY756_12365 [bacterium]|nr:hypothetical protein [bacterium]
MNLGRKVLTLTLGLGLILCGLSVMANSVASAASTKSAKYVKQVAQIDIAAFNGGVISYEASLGAHVKKSQVVLKLDPTQYAAQMEVDEAKLLNDKQIYLRDLQMFNKAPNGTISQQDLLGQKYQVLEDKATVKLDQAYVDQCTVKAPFNGTVTKIINYPGTGVGNGNEIMDITSS